MLLDSCVHDGKSKLGHKLCFYPFWSPPCGGGEAGTSEAKNQKKFQRREASYEMDQNSTLIPSPSKGIGIEARTLPRGIPCYKTHKTGVTKTTHNLYMSVYFFVGERESTVQTFMLPPWVCKMFLS